MKLVSGRTETAEQHPSHLAAWSVISYCCHTVQVSDLIAAKQFQTHSGPVLETLSLQNYGYDCFDFAAPPAAYPVRCFLANNQPQPGCFLSLLRRR